MNLEQVATVAARECIRQHVDIERLVTLLQGYAYVATHLKDREGLLERGVEELEYIGGLIEPDNGGRFRSTPVTFRNGGTAAAHNEIDRLLWNLFYHGENLSVDEWVKQFLWIHPFTDGNGRCGWVLYNLLNGTLEEPEALPEYF